uniref:TonB-dependent receptor n=1 Tax=uncultured Draconibacterium sp. TaxID=1573823 RepID=UPI003216F6F7
MKLLTVFMLSVFAVSAATSYSQQTKFDLKLSDVTVKQVFMEIEEQSEFILLYNENSVDVNRKVNVKVKNETVESVLDQVFKNTKNTFKIYDRQIVILKDKDAEVPSILKNKETQQQQEKKEISGTVIDRNGQPLPGVSVVLKGTTLGMTTNTDGNYRLMVPVDAQTLIFSFIGMKTKEVVIGNQSLISVTLIESITGIEEVVVTGYGTIAKEAYTGSAAVVSSEKIAARPVASFQDVLRGNSPGTIVSGTGQPGVMNTVRLRGISSMNASNAPLYVIDGVILDVANTSGNSDYAINPLNTVNPSDIESITVLKDAASASQYGSRGANGVIVITTKHGKTSDKPQYSFDMQVGVGKIFKASKPDLVNADEFMELWLEGEMHYQVRRKTGFDDFFPEIKKLYSDKENYEISGRNYTEWYNYAKGQFNSHFQIANPEGGYYNQFFDDNGNPGADYNKLANTNWFDEVTRTAPFQKFNISAQGGSNSMNYYTSLEYFNQEGILIGSELKRYSVRTNLSSTPDNTLIHWGINSIVTYSKQAGPRSDAYGYAMPQYTALAVAPVAPVYLEDGSYNLNLPKGVNNNQNPVAVNETNEYLRPQTKILTSGWAQLNFTDWLYLNSRASIDYTHARRRNWYNKDFGDGKSDNGSLYERDARRRKISNTNLLHFNKLLDGIHRVSGYVGTEMEDLDYKYTTATGINFPTNKTPYLSAAATPESVSGSGSTYGMFSVLSAANYSYNNKYYLSATYRNDKSSRFAKDNRAGNFWSVSGAWRISDEAFINSLDFIESLKIKSSYGTNGTLPSEYYAWQSLYSFGYDYMEQPGGVPPSVANTGLTWEKNEIFNIGFDARLFNRLTIGLEYYNRTTKDLLQDLPVSSTSGYTSVLINSDASLKNRGVELDINWNVLHNSNIAWDVNFNMATLKNEFSGLENDIITSTQIRRNGENYYTWYMPEWAGTDPETGEQRWYDFDESGNKIIVKDFAEADKQVLGAALPSVTGGLSNVFTWKDLEFSFLFTYGLGHEVMDYTGRTATKNDGYRDYRGIERDQLDRWTPDNMNGKNPIRVNSSSTWDRYRSSRYLYSGDYLKLKNIKLQYTIPQSLISRFKISSASIFAQAENLFVLTELDGFDPEISLSGFRDADQYPTATTYTAGLKINF